MLFSNCYHVCFCVLQLPSVSSSGTHSPVPTSGVTGIQDTPVNRLTAQGMTWVGKKQGIFVLTDSLALRGTLSVIWVFLLLFLCVVGQSDTDSSDSALTQESHSGGRAEPVAIVTPHLLLAVCGLLDNLLAVLPEFSLSALKHNQILQGLARLERHVKILLVESPLFI